MSYRKHHVSKGARKAHKKRAKAAARKARKKGGSLNPFGYIDMRGKSPKTLAKRMGPAR